MYILLHTGHNQPNNSPLVHTLQSHPQQLCTIMYIPNYSYELFVFTDINQSQSVCLGFYHTLEKPTPPTIMSFIGGEIFLSVRLAHMNDF